MNSRDRVVAFAVWPIPASSQVGAFAWPNKTQIPELHNADRIIRTIGLHPPVNRGIAHPVCMQFGFHRKLFARGKFFAWIPSVACRFTKVLGKRPGHSIVRLSVPNVYRMSTRCPIVRLSVQDVYTMFLERHYAGRGHCITSVYYVTPKR